MRATRAYLAGLGTSGVLLGGVVTLLVVASAVVAYRGATPATITDVVKGLVLDPDPTPALRLEGPSRGADKASTAPRVGPSRQGRATRASRAGGRGIVDTSRGGASGGAQDPRPRPGAQPGAGRDRAPGNPPGPGARPGASSPPPPAPGPPPPRPVRDLTRGAANTVEGVSGGAGQTVGQVSPELGNSVGEAGEAVGDVVGGVDVPR